MNTPVSFEITKLLKEKRFGMSEEDYVQLPRFYEQDGNYIEYDLHLNRKHNSHNTHLGADTIEDFKAHLTIMDNSLDNIYLAPTIAEVVIWLYEKHGIWISVSPHYQLENKYCYELYKSNNEIDIELQKLNSPKEAYEAAIEYTLKNLI